ncbi:MAG TPA: hypothetical protein VFO10_20630 [Oligoflexus sp.]|uniref:hypothetical protein n=1 Tax=Oligoflexus sp. TaxID=1971216 RepID=UPI002D7EE239|nr:hypothetical protein [Oligoflexus sp.]HET9239678.1 hypothetical protein [Oligoflexus sp.]
MSRILSFILLTSLTLACGRDSGSSGPAPQEAQDDATARCAAVSSSITRITDVIALINSLPKPVTLDCVIASLRRPFALNATASVISAQPASSRDKPRIFLHHEGLFLSVVPGTATLEFGETWQSIYSIKGELTFPIQENLADNAPFVGIGPIFSSSQNQTRCGAPCHLTTVEYSKQGGVTIFASQIVRPNPALDIPLDELKAAWKNCSTPDDPACQLYNALFDEADPLSFEFNEDFPFF